MSAPGLEIVALRGIATVQDGGRPGRMFEGLPPGGAWVPELLARANLAVGNPRGAAAIELAGDATVAAIANASGPLRIATCDGDVRELAPGARTEVARHARGRVRYVAIAGGIDVPIVLGGRGTLRVAALGGLDGRALRRGDRLYSLATASPSAPTRAESLPAEPRFDAPVRVILGPDHERFAPSAIAAFLDATYVISPIGDRVGIRLLGPPVARRDADDALSTPMIRGAIEVPRAGEPIVLGPDHPTTGGYPVVATIVTADHGAFAGRKPGATVRFVAVG